MQIYVESPRKVMQNKKRIEKSFNIKLSQKSGVMHIEAKPEDEIIAVQAIEAINLGFSIPEVIRLKEENMLFEKVNIKEATRKRDLERIRGRLIGAKGRSIKTIEYLTDCAVSIHGSTVGVIGKEEEVKTAVHAIQRIIAGSKHSSMYSWLERKHDEEKQNL